MQEGQIKQQKMIWIVPSHAHKIDLSLFRLVNERFLFHLSLMIIIIFVNQRSS